MESWVKLPDRSNTCWERKYLRLEGPCLCTYDHQPSPGMAPINRIDLIEKDGFTVFDTVINPDVMGTAKSDIPFIFRIESNSSTTCWPTPRLDVMALSQTDKKNWLKSLKSITSQNILSNVHRSKKYQTILRLAKNQVSNFVYLQTIVFILNSFLTYKYFIVGFKLCRKFDRRKCTFIGCRRGSVFV